MPDDPDAFTLEAQEARAPRRLSSRELGRQVRLAQRGEAEPEGLGFGGVEYHVPGLEGGGKQPGLDLTSPARDPEPAPEPVRTSAAAALPDDASPADRLRVYLAEVTRDRLGRFVRLEHLEDCSPAGCSTREPAPDVGALIDEHAAFLESIRDVLETAGPGEARELAEVVDAYRMDLAEKRDELVGSAGTDALERVERDDRHSYFVRGALEETYDVEQLDGPGRSRLALLLSSWNKHAQAPYFRKRPDGGARVLAQGPWAVDLSHPFIQRSGVADAALRGIREDPRLWEVEAADPDREEAYGQTLEDELGARERARVRGEL